MAYNPADHTVSAKALGVSGNVATDGRSEFYDTVNFVSRAFVSEAEVIGYLTLPAQRNPAVPIVINTGGTLLNGVITGGVNELWHFKDGKTNGSLVRLGVTPAELTAAIDAATAELPFTELVGTSWNGDPVFQQLTTADTDITLTTTRQNGIAYFQQDSTGGRTLSIDGVEIPVATDPLFWTTVSFSMVDGAPIYSYSTFIASNITLPTPDAPTAFVTDDTADTGGWTDQGGLTFADAEISVNSGATYVNANGNPHTGLTGNHAIGTVRVRYKAVPFVSNASAELSNTVAFTIAADVTAPVLQTATVEDAAPDKIILAYNEVLDNASVPAVGDFVAPLGRTVTAVAVVADSVELTVDTPYANSDGATFPLDYTPGTNPIQDVAGNDALALTAEDVTNNVLAVSPSFYTFSTNVNMLASANDIEKVSGAATTYDAEAVSNETVPLGAGVEFTCDTFTGADILIGLDDNSPSFGMATGILLGSATNSRLVFLVVNGTQQGSNIALWNPGDQFRLIRRADGTGVDVEFNPAGAGFSNIGMAVAVAGTVFVASTINEIGGKLLDLTII